MKRLTTTLIAALTAVSLFAQTEKADSTAAANATEVVGAVIDKSGNPLPGALVKSKKGVETTTDSDGTFSMFLGPKDNKITASYPGLNPKKKGIKKQPVVFELKEGRTGNFALDLVAGSVSKDSFGGGAMFTYHQKWGFYTKIVAGDGCAFTAGAAKRFSSKVSLIFGVGVSVYSYDDYDDYTTYYDSETEGQFMFEVGLPLRFGHFSVTPGISVFTGDAGVGGFIGIGYAFGNNRP